MLIFLHNLYILVWIRHDSLTNSGFAFDTNNSVIKRLFMAIWPVLFKYVKFIVLLSARVQQFAKLIKDNSIHLKLFVAIFCGKYNL